MKVWDPVVRIAHWTLAVCVLTAWTTAEWRFDSADSIHEWTGYAVLAVIALRVVWGFVGSGYARFTQFAVGPSRTIAYAKGLVRGAEARYLGHNPLGAWMIFALLATGALASLSGWLSITDRFWGVAWVQDTHHVLGDALIALATVHVAGVIYTSLRQRENLVAAMLSGMKRPARPGDIA